MGVNVYLDHKKIARLENGADYKLNIEKGKHTLSAKGGLVVKSQEITFEAKENETISLQIESFGNGYAKSFLQIKQLSTHQ